jgi:protein-disulfide isomerase
MIRIILAFLLVASSAFAAPYIPNVVPPKEEVLKIKEDDIIIGCPEAKNVIIEYSSLACPHCAEYFKNVFPKIKSELVNKCKVKYVYRDFPTTKSALKATAVARCISMDGNKKVNSEEFFRLLQTLFSSQVSWAFDNNYEANISKILSLVSVPQERISACMKDNEIATEIISNSFIAMKALKMSHSPSIFINGTEVSSPNYESISKAVQ